MSYTPSPKRRRCEAADSQARLFTENPLRIADRHTICSPDTLVQQEWECDTLFPGEDDLYGGRQQWSGNGCGLARSHELSTLDLEQNYTYLKDYCPAQLDLTGSASYYVSELGQEAVSAFERYPQKAISQPFYYGVWPLSQNPFECSSFFCFLLSRADSLT